MLLARRSAVRRFAPSSVAEERAQGLDPGEQADEVVLAAGREHGADQIVAHTGVLQMHLQPVGKEGQELRAQRIPIDVGQLIAVAVQGLLEGDVQRQPEPILQNQPDGAERGATQREGIPRAGRLLADREEADERVELVGKRHGDADRSARATVVGALRRVMLADRVGDLGPLAVVARVIPAHDALQLGEFPDHAGHQIRLAQQPCPRREVGWRAGHPLRDPAARFSRRAALAPSEPSLAWNTTPSSFGTRLASGRLRS